MDCDEEEACNVLDWVKLLLLGGSHQLSKETPRQGKYLVTLRGKEYCWGMLT